MNIKKITFNLCFYLIFPGAILYFKDSIEDIWVNLSIVIILLLISLTFLAHFLEKNTIIKHMLRSLEYHKWKNSTKSPVYGGAGEVEIKIEAELIEGYHIPEFVIKDEYQKMINKLRIVNPPKLILNRYNNHYRYGEIFLEEPRLGNNSWRFVLAHELAHFVNEDLEKSIPYFTMHTLLPMLLALALDFIPFVCVIVPAIVLLNQVMSYYCRKSEYEADLFAKEMVGQEGGIHFFEERLKYDGDFKDWFRTHPSYNKRIKNIKENNIVRERPTEPMDMINIFMSSIAKFDDRD